MPPEAMDLFDTLGFRWTRGAACMPLPVHAITRVAFRFHRMLPEFVWDAGAASGNPFTYAEVKTLLDGVTVGGRRVSDHEQILNLAESARRLLVMVKAGTFEMDKETFVHLNTLDQGRHMPLSRYMPLSGHAAAGDLDGVFQAGVDALNAEICQPFERAAAFYLFGSLRRFFVSGNRRASLLMMNGILMSAGVDAISLPAAAALEVNGAMRRFLSSMDGTEMIKLLLDSHPHTQQLRAANQTCK